MMVMMDLKDTTRRSGMRRRKGGSLKYTPVAVIFALFVLLLFSCASKKSILAGEDTDEFALLASGGTAYFFIDMAKGKALVDALPIKEVAGKTGEQFLERTTMAVAALYPEGSSRRFLAAAQGNYPGFWGNMSLAFSSAWKKIRSATGKSYWHSAEDGLSIFLQKAIVFVSDADPLIQTPGAFSPPGFRDYRQGAVLAGWTDEPGPPINRFLDSLEIPIEIPAERMFFAVFETAGAEGAATSEALVLDDKTNAAIQDKKYDILIRMETPTAIQARGLLSLFSMVRFFLAGADESGGEEETGILFLMKTIFAQAPVQDGAALNLRIEAMDKNRIALLFNVFFVYSKKI
jgi:hypothetical protein